MLELFDLDGEPEVKDTAEEEDESISNSKYQIASYGADYTIDSLVQRVDREDIYVPPFQRSYVWTINQASKFVESLLLGLPVPGIFLSKDRDRKLVVIDGQQRLLTLAKFYKGVFDDASRFQRFELKNVRGDFLGKTYETLNDDDRRQLDDSILHATIVQQVSPEDDDSSIYHIFERLNTGGTKLQPQEIRACVYYGKFITLLGEINDYQDWRDIYGSKNRRGKDQELILRFLALYFKGDKYQKPLNEFLNSFTSTNRNLNTQQASRFAEVFKNAISVANKSMGRAAFRSQRVLNAAVFDSMLVGIARRLESGPIRNLERVKAVHDELVRNVDYVELYTSATTDEKNIERRIDIATRAFADIE